MIDLEEIVCCFSCDTEAYLDDTDGWVEKDNYWYCPRCRKEISEYVIDEMLAQYHMEDTVNLHDWRNGSVPLDRIRGW